MAEKSLKSQVMSGMFWRFGERICAQLVTFIVSIVLARILSPEHYGAVALLMIFITIANVFVSEGFGKALIQKKDVTDQDYSSVFYFNIIFSWVVYFIIFLSAPFVADFYDNQILSPTLRVMALKIPLAGINSIQHAYVSKNMMFRRFFWSTLIGTIISAGVGIVMALTGFGVWALVAQYLANSLIDTIVLWFTVKWRPKKIFNIRSVTGLLSFGWKILFSSLINTLYENLRSLLIGKFYSQNDLAFYSKGIHYPKLIINNVNTSISSVLFPAMSKIQNDKERLKNSMSRSISMSTFILFPLLMGLAAVADPLIELILTEKWLPCVPYLRIACVYMSLYPINIANLQAIMAVGKSDVYLKLNILKKVIGIVLLLVSLPFGVTAVAASEIFVAILAVLTNASANKKLLGYSLLDLLKDIGKNLCMSLIMFGLVYAFESLVAEFIGNLVISIMIEVVLGAALYIALARLFKSNDMSYVLAVLKKKRGKA